MPAERVDVEYPVYEHEYAEIEKIVPVLESGQPTGRFAKEKQRVVVKSRQVGKKVVQDLVPDKDGTKTKKVPKYGPGGPAKLLDGQIRERGDLDGLWGPVCVNDDYFGKLMTLGQTVRQELDVHIPKKMETAPPAEQEKLVAMGKMMKEFANAYERTHRDVFRAGTRMLQIQSPYAFEDRAMLPGMPYNAYQWVVSDVESTEAATFAIAVAKRAGLLPKETKRLAIKGKSIHPPTKTEAVIKAAAKRMGGSGWKTTSSGRSPTGSSPARIKTASGLPPDMPSSRRRASRS